MSAPPNSDYRYQVGGSLPESAFTYVKRQADSVFYEKLKLGTYCYVLNSRQMGKSSLRVQTMKTLKMEGFACASIEMRDICSHEVTKDEFYGGFINLLVSGFDLVIDVGNWWDKHQYIQPSLRLNEFIGKVLLEEISKTIVIFVDEIDSVLSLEFRDDFFAFIRSCYNKRADNDKYKRLTFALLGVVTPADLIKDVTRSPFNIESQAIELTGFELNQTMPLQKGLEGKVNNPKAVMTKVLEWTGGQPFLTQRLCQLILDYNSPIPVNQEAQCVAEIVRKQIIENWQVRDEQQHLKTIRDRILGRGEKTSRLLEIYQKILQQGEIAADDSSEQMELRLSGLVVKQQGRLKAYNQLYERIFNHDWITAHNNNYIRSKSIEPSSETRVEVIPKPSIPKSPTNNQNILLSNEEDDTADDLSRDRAIDYTRLRDLLAAKNWKDADDETSLAMLQVVGREDGDWIRDEELLNFPCTDLRTIDSLWVKYSNGRFGFSVQKKIYLEVGGIPDGIRYDEEAYLKLCDRVGWRVKDSFLRDSEVIFDTTAPVGHLPNKIFRFPFGEFLGFRLVYFLFRCFRLLPF